MRPLEGLQETRFATREESELLGAQGAPRDPRRDSRGERSPWLPLEYYQMLLQDHLVVQSVLYRTVSTLSDSSALGGHGGEMYKQEWRVLGHSRLNCGAGL